MQVGWVILSVGGAILVLVARPLAERTTSFYKGPLSHAKVLRTQTLSNRIGGAIAMILGLTMLAINSR